MLERDQAEFPDETGEATAVAVPDADTDEDTDATLPALGE